LNASPWSHLRLAGILSIVLAVASAEAVAPASATGGGPGPGEPKLVVLISVDGLGWSWLDRYRPWYVAGLKRLLEEGQVETGCRYRHLNTETGPGHSSLSTGAPPRVTGIVANRWFEQGPDGSVRALACVDQPAPEGAPGTPPMFYREVETEGRVYAFATSEAFDRWQASKEPGRGTTRLGYGPKGETVVFDGDDAIMLFNLHNGRPKEVLPPKGTVPGPGNLRVPTFGDSLVAKYPGSRVVSLSAKDRSAIFMAGQGTRHAVYWYDQDSGRFTTSPVYDPPAASRAVVATFNRSSAGPVLPARFGLAWNRLPSPEPESVGPRPRPTPIPNLLDYQLPSNGLGWGHPLTLNPRGYFSSLYYSPFVDDLVADLALAFLDDESFGLGRGPGPDALLLSFSAQDVVSHSYGTESEENLDVLRRLDLHIGRLLEALDSKYGKGNVALALSADHGFPVIPEALHARDAAFKGGRILTADRAYPTFVDRLNRLLSLELCLPSESRPIYGLEGFNMIYNRPALPARTVAGTCGVEGRTVTTAEIDRALPTVLHRFFDEEILSVYIASQRKDWPANDPATEFVQNDFDPERSGDAILVPRLGVMTHWDPARGAMHGSHYEYDTHVPLVFWGGPFKPQQSSADTTPYDVAPTLAALVGLRLQHAVGLSRAPGPSLP
jgi:hypothetical protein